VFIEAVIMDVNVDQLDLDVGLGYHGGAPFTTSNQKDSAVYGGFNLMRPRRSPASPPDLEALAVGVRGPAIDGARTSSARASPSPPRRRHARPRDGRRLQRAGDAAHPRHGQRAGRDLDRPEHPAPDQRGGGLSSLAGLAGAAGGRGGRARGARRARRPGRARRPRLPGPAQDVGTKIKVTPHVNDSDQVRLELVEEISEAGAPQGTLGAIPINKRTAARRSSCAISRRWSSAAWCATPSPRARPRSPSSATSPSSACSSSRRKEDRPKTNLLLILTPYVIRDQDDLRAIFERKMQERQEFLDRYFVFSDLVAWEPPRDFGRANGLVEDIRQAMMSRGREGAPRSSDAQAAQDPRARGAHPAAVPRRARRLGVG
jgi:general secretion pathway protein D